MADTDDDLDDPVTELEADAGGDGDRDKPHRITVAPDDEPVGYRKPPKHSRFQPGQSGNPRGRPRGARGLRAELKAEVDEHVTLTIDGRPRRVSKLRVVIKALAAKAAKGNVSAAAKLIDLVIMAEGFEDQRPNARPLTDADHQILERMALFENDQADGPTELDADGNNAPDDPTTPITKED